MMHVSWADELEAMSMIWTPAGRVRGSVVGVVNVVPMVPLT
jgi:hypothetical protein